MILWSPRKPVARGCAAGRRPKHCLRGIVVMLGITALNLTAQAEIRLTDATRVEVVLQKPAQRIVALAPHIVELVYAAGAGDRLVGVVSHSDFPKQALQIQRVGSYKTINYEQITGLNPDLILSFGSGNGYEMINRLRALGFTVFVDEPKSLPDVARSMRNIARLTGTEATGEQQAAKFMRRLSELQTAYANRKKVSVFYQVWNQPLITINDQHIISDVIRVCGASNIFADAKPLVPKVSVESVLRRNPRVIIASGMGEERPEWLDEWQRWPSLRAVASEHLYFVPPDLIQRHTPRILEGADLMCKLIEKARNSDTGA